MSRFYLLRGQHTNNQSYRLAGLLLLLAAYGLMVSSSLQNSATVDEQSHLFRGVAYLKTGATHFLLGHPLLAGTLAALPVLTEPDMQLPLTEAAWADGNWAVAGSRWLWQIGNDPQRILFLGRLPIIWLTLLLAALLFRWGWQLHSAGVGLLGLVLFLFDPNLLAHGRLVTTDLALTAFFTLTLYSCWRWQKSGDVRYSWLMGVAAGLAAGTKFNAGLLLPILGLLTGWFAWKQRSWRPLRQLMIAGLIGWAVVWLLYGGSIRPLPGGAFWDDLVWVASYFGKPHGAFLAGEYRVNGWWYYFPVAWGVKNPLLLQLPVLTGIGWALRYRDRDGLFLLWPALFYLLLSMSSSFNIGYRHLLPILPFLALLAALALFRLADRWQRPDWAVWGTAGVSLWLVTLSFLIWPNYISYFNPLVGRDGWQILSDSNVDWGQDLPALARWQQSHRDQPLYLSYFGTAAPSAYGVDAYGLPGWSSGLEQTPPAIQLFDPDNPAPGYYAISLTNMIGTVLGDASQRHLYNYFYHWRPIARLGSIHLYEVEPTGPPVDVAFSDLRPADLLPELTPWESNDLQVRWFDARTTVVWPAGGYTVIPSDLPLDPGLRPLWPAAPAAETAGQQLFRWGEQPEFTPIAENEYMALLDFRRLPSSPDELLVRTEWQLLRQTDHPFKIFLHTVTAAGPIPLTQWDGLDLVLGSLRPGDVFWQLHRLPLPETELPWQIGLGVYDGVTGERLHHRPVGTVAEFTIIFPEEIVNE